MKLLDTTTTSGPTTADVAAAVVHTAQLVLRLVRAAVRRQHPVNLSVTQLRALDYVSANPGTSLSGLADYVGLALPSASVLVDGLARRALVGRLVAAGDLLRRRGRVRPEDLARLHLAEPIDLQALKATWLGALDGAERFVRSRPAEEVGCLYYAPDLKRFVDPNRDGLGPVVPHFGRPGGVLPRVVESPDDS